MAGPALPFAGEETGPWKGRALPSASQTLALRPRKAAPHPSTYLPDGLLDGTEPAAQPRGGRLGFGSSRC